MQSEFNRLTEKEIEGKIGIARQKHNELNSTTDDKNTRNKMQRINVFIS